MNIYEPPSYSHIGSIEWQPKNSGIRNGYGISTQDLQQAAPVSSVGDCFYQGYQKGSPSGPKWRIIITADSLLLGNTLPSNYRGGPIKWISHQYCRQRPYLRISNRISRILGFSFKNPTSVNVKIYATKLNNCTLIILEPSNANRSPPPF